MVKTEVSGKVASVTGERIVITKDGENARKRKFKHDPESGMWVYEMHKFQRSMPLH